MAFEFKFPDVGEGIHEGKIVKWLVKEGDTVAADQSIAEVETDKAIVEIPSPRKGKILKLTHQEGETIHVGEVLVVIEEEQTAASQTTPTQSVQPAQPSTQTAQTQAAQPVPTQTKQPAPETVNKTTTPTIPTTVEASTPVEEKKESVGVVGSLEDTAPGVMKAPTLGTSGAVFGNQAEVVKTTPTIKTATQPTSQTATHLGTQPSIQQPIAPAASQTTTQPTTQAAVQATNQMTTQPSTQPTTQPATQQTTQSSNQASSQQQTKPVSGGVNVVKSEFKAVKKYDLFGYIDRAAYDSVRKAVGNHMLKSVTTIPHVTHMDTADVTDLWKLREKEKIRAEEQGIKLTFLPFFIKAVIAALQKHPYLNASLDEENGQIILKKYYNIGLAVDTEAGLMVPVIKGADKKNILQLAKEIVELAEKARTRKINSMDMKGGTFTITNVGSAGSGLFFTPIINHPEAAILGIGTIVDTPTARKGKTSIRKIVGLSLSFDHRILDGAEAARFVKTLKDHLEDPGQLLVELGG